MKTSIIQIIFSFFLLAGTSVAFAQKDCSNVEPKEQKSCFDRLVAFNLSELIEYPESAQVDQIEGKVLVRFTTDENNQIGNIQIIGKSNPELNEAVLAAVQKLADSNQDGMILAGSVYRIPVQFRLE
ncbi:MAG: energy transducer TonB [Flavobacteriaceae bacterium]|nr:energy transducer TonB [Flavobacteriaceae bacterium]